jgi:hypothetical protein
VTDSQDRRALFATAWLSVGLHLAGLALAWSALRPGTPAVPISERTAYLAQRPLGWAAGWIVWMLCALALVAFLAALQPFLARQRFFGVLALSLASGGAAVDLTCDTLSVVVLPRLAADGLLPLFLLTERALGAGGVVVANGLYSVAVLLATLALPRRGTGRTLAWLGYGTFAAGIVMAVGGWIDRITVVELAAGPTIVLFMAWTLAVARAIDPPTST